jgi:hypothetical protein
MQLLMCKQLLCTYNHQGTCMVLCLAVSSRELRCQVRKQKAPVLARHASHTAIEALPCSCVSAATDASRIVVRDLSEVLFTLELPMQYSRRDYIPYLTDDEPLIPLQKCKMHTC